MRCCMNNCLTDCLTRLQDIKMNGFTTSLDLSVHPLLKTRKKTRSLYFAALEYLSKSCAIDKEYVYARLSQYRTLFVGNDTPLLLSFDNGNNIIKTIFDDFLKPWKRKYPLILLCDIALILLDENAISKTLDIMSNYLNRRKQDRLNELQKILFNNIEIPPSLTRVKHLIAQFRINHNFVSQQVMRVMVTANMSAGKSTLINALIGKPITRTSQEACTANLCYLYNKPFEDNRLHLVASPLNLNATYNDLLNIGRESVSSIASFFWSIKHQQKRICLIDTPGVNSALNSNHGRVTREAIAKENYDKLIYVLNANLLGTDEEISRLGFLMSLVQVYANRPIPSRVYLHKQLVQCSFFHL